MAIVKTERHPDLPPPTSQTGVIGWMRENLFSSPLNIVLTLVAGYVSWVALSSLISYAFIDANFAGTTREDCTGSGACWVFIKMRFGQIMYGFYPEEERWRVDVGYVLVAIGLFFVLSDVVKDKKWPAIYLFGFVPVACYILFSGGYFGLEHVETAQWGGLFLTLVLASVSIFVSLPLGIVLALGRRSSMPVVRMICVGFIEFVRGVPLITVLFMASVMLPLFLPEGVNFDKLVRALVGMSLFASAYMAEVVRGGLQAIPKGQMEAAKSLGLGYWQAMGFIILPQALKISIPSIVNTFIGLFKDTTLVLIIGLLDLLSIVKSGTTDKEWIGMAQEGYIFVAAVFFVFCFGMSRYSIWLENKLHTGHKR
ncbi:MAG: amino acid ABC transporter permease [Sneathiella sp.]|jgi:general L-amino acid transport system permease protein|uniref:amino acid ABC transporter permease n=1 Tax=Sneathiella sp. TaxID=1964365 RepID=UPI000C4DAD20|nr:amino acid ABC transporter permease [Sneathiella sp.]MAL79901.1 amino acid ABC transporter permease [Sneathiella sp.]|tara:strand:+ start:269 stop:1372 length:1104 start_codon:yes stop_codon:yes gene_type:complete